MSKRCFFPLLSFVLFRFSRINFSQAKILSSRKNFIVFSSTDFYTPSSVTIRLCIYVLRNNKNDPRRNF